jgi:hypothetical protein
METVDVIEAKGLFDGLDGVTADDMKICRMIGISPHL